MKRTLALTAVGLIVFLAAYTVLRLHQSLVRERQLGVAEKFPAVELQVIGNNSEKMSLPSGKKTLVVFFRHD